MRTGEVLERLRKDVRIANEAARLASIDFNDVMRDTPSGLPHPDGMDRIRNVSRTYHASLRKSRDAFNTLHNYLMHGILPESSPSEAAKNELVCTQCYPKTPGEDMKTGLFAAHCEIHGDVWHRKA